MSFCRKSVLCPFESLLKSSQYKKENLFPDDFHLHVWKFAFINFSYVQETLPDLNYKTAV